MTNCSECSFDTDCPIRHETYRCVHFNPQCCENCWHHQAKDKLGNFKCELDHCDWLSYRDCFKAKYFPNEQLKLEV